MIFHVVREFSCERVFSLDFLVLEEYFLYSQIIVHSLDYYLSQVTRKLLVGSQDQ